MSREELERAKAVIYSVRTDRPEIDSRCLGVLMDLESLIKNQHRSEVFFSRLKGNLSRLISSTLDGHPGKEEMKQVKRLVESIEREPRADAAAAGFFSASRGELAAAAAAHVSEVVSIPAPLLACLISLNIMTDPKTTLSGYSYEGALIRDELVKTKLDPMTRAAADERELRSNHLLKIICDMHRVAFAAGAETVSIEMALLTCPITKKVMTDPMLAKNGRTYDRMSVLAEGAIDPETGEKISVVDLIPNRAIKDICDVYWDLHPERGAAVTRR